MGVAVLQLDSLQAAEGGLHRVQAGSLVVPEPARGGSKIARDLLLAMSAQPLGEASRRDQDTLGLRIESRRSHLASRSRGRQRWSGRSDRAGAANKGASLRTEDHEDARHHQQTGDDTDQRVQHLQTLG